MEQITGLGTAESLHLRLLPLWVQRKQLCGQRSGISSLVGTQGSPHGSDQLYAFGPSPASPSPKLPRYLVGLLPPRLEGGSLLGKDLRWDGVWFAFLFLMLPLLWCPHSLSVLSSSTGLKILVPADDWRLVFVCN